MYPCDEVLSADFFYNRPSDQIDVDRQLIAEQATLEAELAFATVQLGRGLL